MANQNLFKSLIGKLIPKTDSINKHGAPAYAFSPKHALAQYASTGCLNQTFYATAEEQLVRVLELCGELDPTFIAKTAAYTRQRGFMKDMPALLCAYVSTKNPDLFSRTFTQVVDNGRMLRNFVQIMRSGVVGRKSLGTVPKRIVKDWLESSSHTRIFEASVGKQPSMADIIKMVHPKPKDDTRAALYGYLIGAAYVPAQLPEIVRHFEAFKKNPKLEVPDVPFQMLTSLSLTAKHWKQIARNAPWQMTRMNLNTFLRHGVLEDKEIVAQIAERLSEARQIERAKVFPYQLLNAYFNVSKEVPQRIRQSLHDAMELAVNNIPRVPGKVYVCPDVSGSMQSPVTGVRNGSTTNVRCIDVAALVAAAIVRKNARAEVLPFEARVVNVPLDARDTVLMNAAKLAAVGGGGTNCSAPLQQLNQKKAAGDLVILVSDNESWVDAGQGRGTAMMREWEIFKKRNYSAKLVCIDLQPNATTQAQSREDILNVGGFSDQVFELIEIFASGALHANHWVDKIESMQL